MHTRKCFANMWPVLTLRRKLGL